MKNGRRGEKYADETLKIHDKQRNPETDGRSKKKRTKKKAKKRSEKCK